jgi:hypothetical protein
MKWNSGGFLICLLWIKLVAKSISVPDFSIRGSREAILREVRAEEPILHLNAES